MDNDARRRGEMEKGRGGEVPDHSKGTCTTFLTFALSFLESSPWPFLLQVRR
jgi:hypothetical protein